ncbi:uncharacterized protein BO87DRAFT_392924 [Aspergillus neoniger CBS 115656]|uniref:Uncharacterized protein n=1 Tax=Aspergillus neoniger (strain CBS 115656) TaxID=1448310 RepID=A0A318YWM0_ASPNB|nr:hypothetical protein BO87DRAFT_392924 [Aspergillus neoniger CBS 115656]PYH39275.1 hypothetical protein BO87DRAFT_392924 [Aspergillus neoniger CBS 115656]
MALKAIGCLHLPKLSRQLTLPVMFCMERGPWECNMDFNECRVSPTVSTGHGSETTNQTRGESGLVHNELLQTFPPHLTRIAHWSPRKYHDMKEVVFHPTPGNRYQATRSLDCRSRAFLPVNCPFCTAANSPLRLNSPSSLSKFLINPPRGQIGALSPTVISLTWTSGTLR